MNELSSQNKEILLRIAKEGTVTKKELKEQFKLTDRQVNYAIASINSNLKLQKLPLIVLKNKTYFAKRELVNYFANHKEKNNLRTFLPDERAWLLLTLILSRTSPISLNDFVFEFHVSKNTVLADLKRIRSQIADLGLRITFSRKNGYRLIGHEWDKRMLLYKCILKIYTALGFDTCLQLLTDINDNYLAIENSLLKIEEQLGKKYTDDDFFLLILFLTAITNRIKQNKNLIANELANDEEIKQTAEYQALEQTFFNKFSFQEKSFVALFILGANVKQQQKISASVQTRLINALWEFLNEFELKSFIVLPNKKDLLKKLIDHFRPAYYRIKYKLPDNNPMFKEIIDKYHSLYEIVAQSMTPLNNFFGTQISPDETAFVTIFIGGHLLENKVNDRKRKIGRAIPVCPNGVSTSKILENNLRVAFPELSFYPACSVREYKNFVLPYDVVFSTVPLKSEKTVFVINEILNEHSITKLRNDVFKKLLNLNFSNIDIPQIMKVVADFAEIKDKKGLEDGLTKLLIPESNLFDEMSQEQSKSKPYIKVIFTHQQYSWTRLIAKISEPMIKSKIVNDSFFLALKKEYRDQPDYILLNRQIPLLHLDPDVYPQQLGLTLLVSANPVKYGSAQVNVVALLTTPNKTDHLPLLYQVKNMAEDTTFIHKLSQSGNTKEAEKLVQKFLTA